jgi:hypothetical protein
MSNFYSSWGYVINYNINIPNFFRSVYYLLFINLAMVRIVDKYVDITGEKYFKTNNIVLTSPLDKCAILLY